MITFTTEKLFPNRTKHLSIFERGKAAQRMVGWQYVRKPFQAFRNSFWGYRKIYVIILRYNFQLWKPKISIADHSNRTSRAFLEKIVITVLNKRYLLLYLESWIVQQPGGDQISATLDHLSLLTVNQGAL